jgi:hypothetical protein
MQVISSWTGGQADALREALNLTQETFAEHLSLAVRTVAYWRERPDAVPRRRTQKILDRALERASDWEKEQFARLLAEGVSTSGGVPDSGQPSADGDLAGADARLPCGSGHVVTVLEGVAGADMANRPEAVQAGWLSGTAPGVITGYLFAAPLWHHEEPLAAAPNTAAERIRTVVGHLMDMDFQFGGGYVRRMLLFYFQSEIVPLLRERHPANARREMFSAAAEVAELPGFLFAEPVFA